MSQAEDFIDYLRTLTRGYDTRLFDRNLSDLNKIVLERGLNESEFNGLVKVWLNCNVLSISKWIDVGLCVIPPGRLADGIVRLIATWAVTQSSQTSYSRTKFVLNWLTAVLDLSLLNLDVLDEFFEIFFSLFCKEKFASVVIKLVYTLTKPFDVTRSRVTQLLNNQKTLRGLKRRNEINVLLSLFKSYKPECVPEAIPAIAVQSIFPKMNRTLLERLKTTQRRLQRENIFESVYLQWQISSTIPYVSKGRVRNQVVPDLDFLRLGSTLYSNGDNAKTFLHFKKNEDVLRFCQKESIARPAQLVSLLCNDTGQTLLALMEVEHHSVFSHKLLHLLHCCLLEDDTQYTLYAKTDFLRRLANFQYIIQQPVPVVSNFLAAYLPMWNGVHHCQEIWSLLEWVTFDSFDEMHSLILKPIETLFISYTPVKRYLILKSLARMYSNLCFTTTKEKHVFLNSPPNPDAAKELLTDLSIFIERLCREFLIVYPANTVAHMSCLYTYDSITRSEFYFDYPKFTVLPIALSGFVLLSSSAVALDTLARLILDYANLYKKYKRVSKASMRAQMSLVETMTQDVGNALWFEELIVSRGDGIIFKRCSDHSCLSLQRMYKNANAALCINNHFALAAYTYARFNMADDDVMTKEAWLEEAIAPMLRNLHNFIVRIAG